MEIINVEQGSDAWKDARCARVTASRIKDILAKVKSGEAASRANYRAQIVAERASGKPQDDDFFSKEMRWGVENEPYARAAYEMATGTMVHQVGMVVHPKDPRCAASPDGVVGWDGKNEPEGLIEAKCPLTKNHLAYIKSGIVPPEYQGQILWQLAVTGAKWCDFVSFDPRLVGKFEPLQLYICRMERDEARIRDIEMEVERFLDECDCEEKSLLDLIEQAA